MIEASLDYIGFKGYMILSAMTLGYLFTLPFVLYVYLLMFVVGSLLNYALILILKIWIREPRPSKPVTYIYDNIQYKGAVLYGMPSGHAQVSFFCITYLYLMKCPLFLFLLSVCIGGLTVFQRWKYRRHTVMQLIMGMICGCLLAYFIFWITRTYMDPLSRLQKKNVIS
jgi:membrane-associated phospholipid phosphatase